MNFKKRADVKEIMFFFSKAPRELMEAKQDNKNIKTALTVDITTQITNKWEFEPIRTGSVLNEEQVAANILKKTFNVF